MTLALVVDTLARAIRDGLEDPPTVGDATPAARAELPTVAIGVTAADPGLAGIGGLPSGPRSGALSTTDTVDLAEPTLLVGDESIPLLSPDRRELLLTHGPVVSADGTSPPPPLGGDDVTVDVPGPPLVVVGGEPGAREVRVDATDGRLVFGSPLPTTGEVRVAYHVGTWDVTVVRFTGTLAVEVHDEDGDDVAALSRAVATLLATPPAGFDHLRPTAWAASELVGDHPGGGADHRVQRLGYAFSFEREIPALATSGGLIRRVAVSAALDDAPDPERFDVPVGAGTT